MAKERERINKYISIKEISSLKSTKTQRWWVIGRDGKPFGIIKWYGGWRKYVCHLDEGFFDWDCMRLIADFCEKATKDQLTKKPVL